jgi:hypothetical protein
VAVFCCVFSPWKVAKMHILVSPCLPIQLSACKNWKLPDEFSWNLFWGSFTKIY